MLKKAREKNFDKSESDGDEEEDGNEQQKIIELNISSKERRRFCQEMRKELGQEED